MKKNKGFSLVELIIVIAIMVILVAILAPQFLKYVERSRNAADIANARKISEAVEVYLADGEHTLSGDDVVFVCVNEGAPGKKSHIWAKPWYDDNIKVVENAIKESGLSGFDSHNLTGIRCKSKQTWDMYMVQVRVFDGNVKFYYEAKKGGEDHGVRVPAFTDYFSSVSNNNNPSGTVYP